MNIQMLTNKSAFGPKLTEDDEYGDSNKEYHT